MELFIPIAVALVAVVAAWKLFKGLMKTAALLTILTLAGFYALGGGFA
ncbi:MAG: hypothetical protein J7493_04785 [Porphyrobacter sp.]|nr:hypothetical protein [Porphyrobacter sp.]